MPRVHAAAPPTFRSSLALRWLECLSSSPSDSPTSTRSGATARRAAGSSSAGRLAAVQREIADIDHRIALSGEDAFIEREARRLGLVRPASAFIVKGVEDQGASVP